MQAFVRSAGGGGTWHDLNMPMLDGLYLLNLLRAAAEEQHLGLSNRE